MGNIKPYNDSILCDMSECYFCCTTIDLVRHEVYQGKSRQMSKYYGLWVTLCPKCHREIHNDPQGERAEFLNKLAETKALQKYRWSVKDFIQVIGKNYL